ncbi:MAG: membrane protein insertase YidC, partial [Rhodanobacter sp.]
MNQTRNFLLFALLAVAYLLFMAWEKDYAPQAPVTASSATISTGAKAVDGSVPSASLASASSAASTKAATIASDVSHAGQAPSQRITVDTDVLHLQIDTRGGTLVRAELLGYPSVAPTHKNPNPPPTVLLDSDPSHYFVAQNGLVSSSDSVSQDQPNHLALFRSEKTSYAMAPGQNELQVALTWQDAGGLKVTKTYTFRRGSYVIGLSQHIDNGTANTWQGNAYQQLQRVEPSMSGGWLSHYTDPEKRSFIGAAWYNGEKFEKLEFKNFSDKKDALDSQIKGGWAAMLRLYFVTAWIPPAGQTDHYVTQTISPDSAHPRYLIRAMGPALSVAPGQSFTAQARLYAGP